MSITFRYEDVRKIILKRRRDAMRVVLSIRYRSKRYGRRNISDSLKLGLLALRHSNQYVEVIQWSRNVRDPRILRIR
ncbi:MAG TPA: hypothetical protein ENG05_02170 [Acidilobales archaeon]|nr:hypothetical protein [Acidilobales archaeon]